MRDPLDLNDALWIADKWVNDPLSTSDLGPTERSVFRTLLSFAQEALGQRRRDGETGDILPPEDPGRGDGGRDRVCGSCGWCHRGPSEENADEVGKCHVDPPVIWKGQATWRFLRPEVGDRTPACSRWRMR